VTALGARPVGGQILVAFLVGLQALDQSATQLFLSGGFVRPVGQLFEHEGGHVFGPLDHLGHLLQGRTNIALIAHDALDQTPVFFVLAFLVALDHVFDELDRTLDHLAQDLPELGGRVFDGFANRFE
jgi:hypothetical protein